ncbi:MAG: LysM peptidoglycan-binding domain-containing protein [Anaerolineales bacterium]
MKLKFFDQHLHHIQRHIKRLGWCLRSQGWRQWLIGIAFATLFLAGCNFPMPAESNSGFNWDAAQAFSGTPPSAKPETPVATRPIYAPGELVDYTAQSGDTLPLLAARFNTTVDEILTANTFIPRSATTMPPGMPMKIPIYYVPLWGSSYRIIPDELFVNGPALRDFDTSAFIAQHSGWLNGYSEYASNGNHGAGEIIDIVAQHFSVSPTLLLALLEFHSGGLTNPKPSDEQLTYPLGYHNIARKGLYSQLIWTANTLNNGYYGFRSGNLLSIEYDDGREERFDPWLNAASAALHYYFNLLYPYDAYQHAIGADGLAKTYRDLFGDPWAHEQPHIPGSLEQPALAFPFKPGEVWALTGGPHTGWGTGQPYSALDFAPPSVASGCVPTELFATALAPGVVARVGTGELVLDLDGDGDERTGWVIFYLHVSTKDRAALGSKLNQGDPIGHPSCEGGTASGTHIHIARKYNGEWILDEGVLAFNLEGWIAYNGSRPYLGYLKKNGITVTANENATSSSLIQSSVP